MSDKKYSNTFMNHSSCSCCIKCDKRGINQRFGYIIPCVNKFNCPEYLEIQETIKQAKQREREERQIEYESVQRQIERKKRRR